MSDDCACGHVMDEHEWSDGHPTECSVEDCPCIYFEAADDDD